jgi:unconventional prefoldin RPB5 interactor 1
MDIEEFSDSEVDSEEDEDEDENEYGMNNVNDEISEDYIREMEALMQKHMMNIGNGDRQSPRVKKPVAESTHTPAKSALRTVDSEQIREPKKTQAKPKRGVKFADNLDIAPVETTDGSASKTSQPAKSEAPPMAEVIVERPKSTPSSSTVAEKPKLSRFKAAKQASAPSPASVIKSPMIDDELSFTEELQQYKQRMGRPQHEINRRLYEDPEDQPESNEKMSKFKAARLGISQDN